MTKAIALAACLLATFCVSPLFAEFQPKLELGTAFVWGEATEYVLRDGTYDKPVSRLRWEIPPSSALNLTASLPWTEATSTRLRMRAALPWFAGVMTDEDWDTGELPDDISYARSRHQGYLRSSWTVSAEQTLKLGSLSFLAGGEYRWLSWEGWNGQGHYEYVGGYSIDHIFQGLLIAYRQEWFLPYIGLSYSQPTNFGEVTFEARYGPYTWCNDMDNHNYAGVRTLTFLDYVNGGQYLRANLDAVLSGGPNWSWGLRFEGALAWGAVGTSVTTYSQQGTTINYPTYPGQGGAEFYETSLSLFMRN